MKNSSETSNLISYEPKDFPSISVMKWAMLVTLLEDGEKGNSSNLIDVKVARMLNISPEMFKYEIKPGKPYFSYRMSWERTKAKKQGYIEKIPGKSRMWRLTSKGTSIANRKRKSFRF